MTDENSHDTITNDDLGVLRVLLYRIKGLSAVSTTPEYVINDDSLDEQG